MNKFSLLCAVFITISAYAETPEDMPEDMAAGCAKIKTYAAQGDQFYKQKNYKKARDSYESQVGWSEACDLGPEKIATAYNNVALTYIREGDYLKARAWLQVMPDDKKSIFNLNLIKDKLPAANSSSAASPEGEYWRYVGKSIWNRITIKAEKAQYAVDFEGYYAGFNTMLYGPNMGDFSTLLSIEKGRAVYVMAEEDAAMDCVYNFSIKSDSLTLARVSGDACGFGHNVYAEGSYLKVVQY